MSRASAFAAAAVFLALFAVLTALFAVFAPHTQTVDQRTEEARAGLRADEGALLEHMVLFQRYIEKSALAAEADNWPLAAFYAQKIRGNAALVVDGGYVVNGIDVSAIAEEVALSRAERLVEAASTSDAPAFAAAYGEMIDGCNTCHRRAGYRFVQIVPPDSSRYPSQDFTRAPTAARTPPARQAPPGN